MTGDLFFCFLISRGGQAPCPPPLDTRLGLFYHAACGGLLAIFISMHMGSFNDFFSMWGPFLLLFLLWGGGLLCSYGGLFWACLPPPPYKHLYGRQCPGCPNEEKNVAKRPPPHIQKSNKNTQHIAELFFQGSA